MSQVSENVTVNTILAKKLIKKCFDKKRPLFLWGPPGIGKSDVINGIAEEMGGISIDFRLAQCEPTDLRGIPYLDKETNTMNWARPIDLPSEEEASKYPIVVLFLDELNSAPSSIQAAAYQLVLNRKVGVYKAPDNMVIIAAGNRDSDKGVTYRMPSPLANRFVHVELRADFEAWEDWASRNRLHQDIVGYLGFAKQDLYDFDPRSSDKSFATPRSWSFVNEFLDDNTTDDELLPLIAGCIGQGTAIKFLAHRKIASKMPNPDQILDGKVTELKTEEISAMYSLTVSLCYELVDRLQKINGKPDDKWHESADRFFSFMMQNFTKELCIMGARNALNVHKLPIHPGKITSFDKFHKQYGKYIVKASGK